MFENLKKKYEEYFQLLVNTANEKEKGLSVDTINKINYLNLEIEDLIKHIYSERIFQISKSVQTLNFMFNFNHIPNGTHSSYNDFDNNNK